MTAVTIAPGLTTRPLTTADVPAVVDILAEVEAAEPAGVDFLDQTELDEMMSSPMVNLPAGSLAVLDGPEMVAFGLLDMPAPVDVFTAGVVGGVRTGHTRRGIGRFVLDELAGQARRLRDEQDPGQPGELRLWLWEGRTSTEKLAFATGFEPWRYFFDMRRDLADPLAPAEPLPAGLELEPWTPALDESTLAASNEAFADHWGSTALDFTTWRSLFAEASSFRPALSRLAVSGGRVVSFVLVAEYAAETEKRGYRTGYISRVGTTRDARGRGVASALLTSSLRAQAEQGYRFSELGVDAESPTGAGRIYQRQGFREFRRNMVHGRRF